MIVSNSTPLIHLARIGQLELLNRLFRKVLIPKTVFDEVVVKGEEQGYSDAKVIRKATEEWMEIRELNEGELKELENILKIGPLGRGEGEAITLAKGAKLPLLIDDLLGQKIAKIFAMETYWTTSIILKAFTKGLITKSEAKEIIEDLINSGLRIRSEVVVELMKILS